MIASTILMYDPADFAGSPRTRWQREHNLILRDYQGRSGWERHSLNTDRYLCANRAMTKYASGSSPDAAEAAFCAAYGLQWWKLAGWNEAMGDSITPQDVANIWAKEVPRWQAELDKVDASAMFNE